MPSAVVASVVMRATIDAAGRVVIPKSLRDALGFAPGTELELTTDGDRLEVATAPVEVEVIEKDGVPVLVPEKPQPPLTVEKVRELIERGRR
jgi:AbrB family looped-hinge helix DNA binding protein